MPVHPVWMSFQSRPLSWATTEWTRRCSTDTTGEYLQYFSTVGYVGTGPVSCCCNTLLVECIAVHNSRLHQPEKHFAPPLPCFPLEGVVHGVLVCNIDSVHIVVVKINHSWLLGGSIVCALGLHCDHCCRRLTAQHEDWLVPLLCLPCQCQQLGCTVRHHLSTLEATEQGKVIRKIYPVLV